MKATRFATIFALTFLLLGTSPVFASSPHSSISLSLSGAILSSGTESYSHSGGQVVAAYVLGAPVDLQNAIIHYSLQASVAGLGASGVAQFDLQYGHGGSHSEVSGQALIGDMIPAEEFPLGCTLGVDCSSAIPGAFLGLASVTLTSCDNGNGHCSSTDMSLPMEFESAFLNPFGGPIVMASEGGELVIIATYSQSRVSWAGIQLGGLATGSLAGSPVAGGFSMNVSAVEDLRGGYELDHGTIAFVGMSDPSVNGIGTFVGRSIIPMGTPCPSYLGFPPGTCQLTGFHSSGVFSMSTFLGSSIHGSYSTDWTVPAVAFTSSVSGTLK